MVQILHRGYLVVFGKCPVETADIGISKICGNFGCWCMTELQESRCLFHFQYQLSVTESCTLLYDPADLLLTVVEFFSHIGNGCVDEIALDKTENCRVLMLPKEILCPRKLCCAFKITKERNKECTHQHIEQLITVGAVTVELLRNLTKEIKDLRIFKGIKMKICGTFLSGKRLSEKLSQEPAFK